MFLTVTNKSGIVVVSVCARFYAIIATSAPIKIDYHRLRSVDVSMFDKKFQQPCIHAVFTVCLPFVRKDRLFAIGWRAMPVANLNVESWEVPEFR